jgi:asparagine synthase (glutamine-hydrolysing)
LKDSIKLRFRADVKVGFNVSGGVDSSTLLAFVNMMYGEDNIEAYTFYTNNECYDELYWVENMIETTSSPLTKVLTTSETVISSSKILSFYQDEPFGGIPTIAYNKIFETARANGTLVLLDGQGMDEQWAGYDYYNKNNNAIIQGVNKSPLRPNVLNEVFFKKAIKPVYPKPFNDKILDMQFRDLFYTKIPRALRFNDRISMANSTELREPFLDYRLVEYAFVQPIDFKIKNGVQKYMLRDIVGEYLSDTISYAPKRPLQTPQREWLANELKEEVSTIIDSIKHSNFKHWFNLEKLENEWQQYINGNQESSFHIWQWLSYSFAI